MGDYVTMTSTGDVEAVTEKLKQLGQDKGMPIAQTNGQRRYGPPTDWKGPSPPKGSEVFVGKLPRHMFEPEIVALFETMGRIYEMRLMMDFSGMNRGYCFVQYTCPEDARKAIRELNGFEIEPGTRLGVMKSVDNCRLFIRGVPKNVTQEQLLKEITSITEGVTRVVMHTHPHSHFKNRGFAFVEYESHKAAAMARRKMICTKVALFGQDVSVDWAEPEPEVRNLYVRNLNHNTQEETLRQVFNQVSNNGVERVQKLKDFAFIHFHQREQAACAKNALDKSEIDGTMVEIYWGKPKSFLHEHVRGKQRNNNIRQNATPPATSGRVGQQSAQRSSIQNTQQQSGLRTSYKRTCPMATGKYNSVPVLLPVPPQLPAATFAANAFQYSVHHSVNELSNICLSLGWAEPNYEVYQFQDGPTTMYFFRVTINTGGEPRCFSSKAFPSLAHLEVTRAAVAQEISSYFKSEFWFFPIAPNPQ